MTSVVGIPVTRKEQLFKARELLNDARNAIAYLINLKLLTEHDVDLLLSMHKNMIGISSELLMMIDDEEQDGNNDIK